MNNNKEEEAVIEFSARLAEAFREKVKKHNSSCPNKVNVSQVTKVYKQGVATFNSKANLELDINSWSMARVNSYMRGGPARKVDKDIYNKTRARQK